MVKAPVKEVSSKVVREKLILSTISNISYHLTGSKKKKGTAQGLRLSSESDQQHGNSLQEQSSVAHIRDLPA